MLGSNRAGGHTRNVVPRSINALVSSSESKAGVSHGDARSPLYRARACGTMGEPAHFYLISLKR